MVHFHGAWRRAQANLKDYASGLSIVGKQGRPSIRATVHYPKHAFGIGPQDYCSFVEAKGFSDDWIRLGFGDTELDDLQVHLTVSPKGSPVIPGTGGLRKLRWTTSARKGKRGKQGGTRICYAYFESAKVVLLVIAYSKDERDDIPEADKAAIKEYLKRQESVFSKRMVK